MGVRLAYAQQIYIRASEKNIAFVVLLVFICLSRLALRPGFPAEVEKSQTFRRVDPT